MPCSKEVMGPYMISKYKQTDIGYNKPTLKQIESKMKQDSKTENSPTVHDRILTEMEVLELEKRAGNLVLISDFVKEKRNAIIQLPESKVTKNMYIRICGLDGTIYKGEEYMFLSWEELYLPEPTKMEVLGILESSKGPVLPQLVVLVAEDGRVYGYEDEVLHLFAVGMKEMIQDGIKDTGISYDYPEALSDEDEEVLKKDEEIQRIRQRTKKFIDKDAESFGNFLDSF